jgi:hypothetical protein
MVILKDLTLKALMSCLGALKKPDGSGHDQPLIAVLRDKRLTVIERFDRSCFLDCFRWPPYRMRQTLSDHLASDDG